MTQTIGIVRGGIDRELLNSQERYRVITGLKWDFWHIMFVESFVGHRFSELGV